MLAIWVTVHSPSQREGVGGRGLNGYLFGCYLKKLFGSPLEVWGAMSHMQRENLASVLAPFFGEPQKCAVIMLRLLFQIFPRQPGVEIHLASVGIEAWIKRVTLSARPCDTATEVRCTGCGEGYNINQELPPSVFKPNRSMNLRPLDSQQISGQRVFTASLLR